MESFEFTGLVSRGEKAINERYRPYTFHEVIGNEATKKALAGWMERGQRRTKALLLTGPSGTGKTTISRILAMGLNCERGDTVNPCCECPSCRAAMAGDAMHIVECNMSALSRKEDADDIVASMYNTSFTGRNNVYTLDEAQGMSSGSQNLMLKILENPPDNTYVILATTDPQKILKTVKTRCEQYQLANPLQEDIKKLLASVVSSEMPSMTKEQRVDILKACQGLGFREILMKLEKFIKGGGTGSIEEAFQPDFAAIAKCVLRGDFAGARAEMDKDEQFDVEGARRVIRSFLANQLSRSTKAPDTVRAYNAFKYFDHGFYTDPNPRPSFIADLAMACLVMAGQIDPPIITLGNK